MNVWKTNGWPFLVFAITIGIVAAERATGDEGRPGFISFEDNLASPGVFTRRLMRHLQESLRKIRSPFQQDYVDTRFRPWGGKRTSIPSEKCSDSSIYNDQRTYGKCKSISHWGGRRYQVPQWLLEDYDENKTNVSSELSQESSSISEENSEEGSSMYNEIPREIKRNNKFNPWGGKRNDKFNPWGGKRNDKFNPWGGKRNDKFNPWGGKRNDKFNPWGGKRNDKFNPWGGKRTDKFNPWGGKRNDKLEPWTGKSGLLDFGTLNEFQNYSSSEETGDEDKLFPTQTENAYITGGTFSSLTRKRRDAEELHVNKAFLDGKQVPNLKKMLIANILKKYQRENSPSIKFYPWAGKRSPN